VKVKTRRKKNKSDTVWVLKSRKNIWWTWHLVCWKTEEDSCCIEQNRLFNGEMKENIWYWCSGMNPKATLPHIWDDHGCSELWLGLHIMQGLLELRSNRTKENKLDFRSNSLDFRKWFTLKRTSRMQCYSAVGHELQEVV
jgi:hypothetical protein